MQITDESMASALRVTTKSYIILFLSPPLFMLCRIGENKVIFFLI
jgi:hypothetical protein